MVSQHTAATCAFVWAPDLPLYDFGPGHPMAPVRLDLTHDLVTALNLPGLVEIDVAPVDDDTLALVHTAEFIAAVHDGERGIQRPEYGLGTDDNPIFPEIHLAASRLVGATLAGARSVWTSPVPHAVSIAGGMHHAMPGRASGFCVYNDVAIAIQWLLDNGARRVAYVDLDAHHGDGVEQVFWNEPRVLTVSVHESGTTLFPGTGFPVDTGGPGAQGSAVNVALPAGTRGDAWLRAVDAVVPAVVREFAPDVLVTQHGADSHSCDPLTNLRVSVDHQLVAAAMMRDLAAEVTKGRWLATGGGGYTVVEVVPRVWAGLTALSAGARIDFEEELPLVWRDAVEQRLNMPTPPEWGDDVTVTLRRFSQGYDPADDVDRAIMATRAACFPLLGLDSSW